MTRCFGAFSLLGHGPRRGAGLESPKIISCRAGSDEREMLITSLLRLHDVLLKDPILQQSIVAIASTRILQWLPNLCQR